VPVALNKTVTGLAGLGFAGAVALSLGAAAGVTALTATEASAQGFFSAWDSGPRPRRSYSRPRRPKGPADAAVNPVEPDKPVNGPLVLNVSIRAQRLTVYDANGIVAEAPVSTGRVGYATPMGVFTILEKNRVHFSNLYGNAPMPNMQRITWSGVALHAGDLPGYPASHGCIRLPHGFSKKLFGMTKMGARVIVSRDPVSPISFEHQRLFAAYPPEPLQSTGALPASFGTQVADASDSTVGSSDAAPAALEPVTSSPPRSPYRQRREAELAQISVDIRNAGYNKTEAASHAVAMTKDAQIAREAYLKVRAEADRLQQAAKKAAATKQSAESEFKSFAAKLKSARTMTDEELQRAAEKEDALEASAFATGDAAELARKTAAEAAQAVKAVEIASNEAEAKHQAAVADLAKSQTRLTAALGAGEAAKRREAKRKLPVSVFVSRATQRLYVRQGYEPIFDLPVTIDEPNKAIGTHVFTALDYKQGQTELTWNVASISTPAAIKAEPKPSRRKAAKAPPPPAPVETSGPQTPAQALERLSIPEEAREQIADVMKPGSSLVISDFGIGNETGKFTDFIVSLR
jgi:lipoprotein-anchoring transpeptidase ErfK/SrfK